MIIAPESDQEVTMDERDVHANDSAQSSDEAELSADRIQDLEPTDEEAAEVQGGGLLLPAVQAAREHP